MKAFRLFRPAAVIPPFGIALIALVLLAVGAGLLSPLSGEASTPVIGGLSLNPRQRFRDADECVWLADRTSSSPRS